jgi:hypothetical protein
MRLLKAIGALTLVAALVAALVVPGVWLYTAATLPSSLESALDVETHLRQSIESERLGLRGAERRSVKWDRPDASKLPKRLLALFITETGCPTYFQTPRDDGWPWLKRLAWKTMTGRDADGDGACELIFARMLARRLGAQSPLQVAVASERIHRFLQKDQLVAFNLMSFQFEPGLVGVEDAARELLGKELKDMNDAELAELQLAVPPWSYWDDVKSCTNAPLIRQSRDQLLKRLAGEGLMSEEMAKTAAAQPPRCLSVKR